MILKVKFKYEMEYVLKTWSELCIEGSGFWRVNTDELCEEFNNSEYNNFKEFLDFYFTDFSGLDLGDRVLTIDEEDLKKLESEYNYYYNENRNSESNLLD